MKKIRRVSSSQARCEDGIRYSPVAVPRQRQRDSLPVLNNGGFWSHRNDEGMKMRPKPSAQKAPAEQSHLSARSTLEKLGVPRATFYRWYDQYQTGGPSALEDQVSQPGRIWNRIPDNIRDQILDPSTGSGGVGAVRVVTPRTGSALHRRAALLRVRSLGLPPVKGP